MQILNLNYYEIKIIFFTNMKNKYWMYINTVYPGSGQLRFWKVENSKVKNLKIKKVHCWFFTKINQNLKHALNINNVLLMKIYVTKMDGLRGLV